MFGYIKKSEVEKMLLILKEDLRAELEAEVRLPNTPVKYRGGFFDYKTLGIYHEELREDFEEVDQKVDKLEKFLGIEFVELEGNISHDDVAERVNTKEYRKLETFKK